LTIHNERPISAADLGDLFSSLAKDYRQITGDRTLVVTSVATGSYHVNLQDMVTTSREWAEAAAPYFKDAIESFKVARGMRDMFNGLRGIFNKGKQNPAALHELRGRAAVGRRSVRSMSKIASEFNCQIEVKTVAMDGTAEEIRITPQDARRIVDGEAARSTARLSSAPRTLFAGPSLSSFQVPSSQNVERAVRQLSSVSDRDLPLRVRELVASLRAWGMEHMIGQIARELEQQGQFHISTLLVGALRAGGQEPPLTNSN
jgi:hypothetical protein